ncbi:MAG: tyrosine-type recombinase/integrase [Chloroflexi bacterium]|nr:tyrosine-type recombinase/integrase [Chloroflexota bacterium]
MPTQLLTAEFLATIAGAPQTSAVNYFDAEIKGFLLEHRAGGGATYYFRYRDPQRRVRQIRIGRVEEIDLGDARAKAYAFKKMVAEGGDPHVEGHRLRDIPNFAAFIEERYLPYAKTRKRSWETDESLLRNHLVPRFGEYRLNRITRGDIITMHHAAKEAGYAAGTANRWLVLMRFVFNCAIRWDVLPVGSNPTSGVSLFEDNGARERYLTPQEIQRLFSELERNPNKQVGQVIQLLLYTGARKREVLDARWEFVDFERRLLTVPLSKSGKPRHIPLSDAAIKLLKNLPRASGIPWVFFNPKTGKPPVSIFHAWDTIRKRVGLGEVRLHDLRHSFASVLVNQGCSLYEVQRLLGHADTKTTMRYAHLSPQALVDAANVVGAVVERAVAQPAV